MAAGPSPFSRFDRSTVRPFDCSFDRSIVLPFDRSTIRPFDHHFARATTRKETTTRMACIRTSLASLSLTRSPGRSVAHSHPRERGPRCDHCALKVPSSESSRRSAGLCPKSPTSACVPRCMCRPHASRARASRARSTRRRLPVCPRTTSCIARECPLPIAPLIALSLPDHPARPCAWPGLGADWEWRRPAPRVVAQSALNAIAIVR